MVYWGWKIPGCNFSIWFLDKKRNVEETLLLWWANRCRMWVLLIIVELYCLCDREAQQTTKCTAFTNSNSSALNSREETYLCCSHGSLSLTSAEPLAHNLNPLPLPCCLNTSEPFSAFPFSGCTSLICCCCLSIKGGEEACHLTFLPTPPFIFKQRKVQRLTVGFRVLLFALFGHTPVFSVPGKTINVFVCRKIRPSKTSYVT